MDLSLTLPAALLLMLSALSGIVLMLSLASWLAIRWTNRMRDLQTKVLSLQLSHSQAQVTDLMNRVMSADAITYSTLVAQTNSSGLSNEPVSPVGTDVDEYNRWLATLPEGSRPDDYTSDLTDAGLYADESGTRYA